LKDFIGNKYKKIFFEKHFSKINMIKSKNISIKKTGRRYLYLRQLKVIMLLL
jgi:hypothetical protein